MLPRVQYVGQLATIADLKRSVGVLDVVGGAIFGMKSPHAMLSPYGVCTDSADRIFVADSNAQLVHVFYLSTRRYARWTPKKPIRFTQPVGVAYNSGLGRLYVSDSVGATVHIF